MSTRIARVLAVLGGAGLLVLLASSLPGINVTVQVGSPPTAHANYQLAPTYYYTETVPGLLSYQGFLADGEGDPYTGTFQMAFSIYSTTVGGPPLWSETDSEVVVRNGNFSVLLGDVILFPDGLFAQPDRYLGVQVVGYPEMTPRQRFASVAYAINADLLDGESGDFYRSATNVITGTLDPAYFSAYADLGVEGYLDDDADLDLMTRVQANGRFVNEGQADSITTGMIQDGAVTTAKLNVDSGLGVNGNLTVTGNIGLYSGNKEILFSDPGNYDFSIVHNGGQSLDFRSPEVGITAMSIENGGDVGVGVADPQYKLDVDGAIQSSINIILRYQTVTTDGSGQASMVPYAAVLKPAHWWDTYWHTDYDFNYNESIGLLTNLPPNEQVVVYYISAPGGQGNPVSSPPDW